VEKVEARNLLKRLQGNYLRMAVGTMRTTPTEVLETAFCIYPLDLTIMRTTYNTAYRLKCQGDWRDTRLGSYWDILASNGCTLTLSP